MKKQAFITLMTTLNYLPAVLILNKSIKDTNSQYPFVVAIPEDIFSEQIQKIFFEEKIEFQIINRLTYSKNTIDKWKDKYPMVLNTASKIEIFLNQDYDKLLFIDADSLVLKNIDHLFNYPNGAMARLIVIPENNSDKSGLSNLFVFEPKYHNYEFYKKGLQYYDCFDGDLLGELWFPVKNNMDFVIPAEYYSDALSTENYDPNIHIIHLGNRKLWLPKFYEFDSVNYYIKIYNRYLNQILSKYELESFCFSKNDLK